MSSKQSMQRCRTCGKPTLHVQPSTSHLLHLILTACTFGFWLLVWILITWSHRTQAQCTVCGRQRGILT